jgi:hypothetical protein
MGISNPHNLNRAPTIEPRPYGLRVSLRALDPFAQLCGADWQRTHWYTSAAERDAAMAEMSRKHEYSRPGDRPALVFTKVENLAASRGL